MTYKFNLKVLIQRRPHMRDDNLEYVFMIGISVLRQIFDEERVDPTLKKVVLYFPERYMNIVEERCLLDRLAHFCPNLESVEIMTQSVSICVHYPMCAERQLSNSAVSGRTRERNNGVIYDRSPLEKQRAWL